MKVSFDFDSTLDTQQMQDLCRKFIELGSDVFVTTSRSKVFNGKVLPNEDLFKITDALGIKRENITFTAHQDKYDFVKEYDLHFDDDMHEIYLINQHHGKCIGFLFEERPDNGERRF